MGTTGSSPSAAMAATNKSGTRLKSTKSSSYLFKDNTQMTLSQKSGRLSWGRKSAKEIPPRNSAPVTIDDEDDQSQSEVKRTKRVRTGARKEVPQVKPAY